jgi:Domain of unknown function (DUF4365)
MPARRWNGCARNWICRGGDAGAALTGSGALRGMTRNQRQEALSRAYVQAVAAQAGFGHTPRQTDYGIDLSLYEIIWRGRRCFESGIILDVQVKSTTRAAKKTTVIGYDLDVKSFDDLRYPGARNPRLLVVVVFPRETARWLSQSEDELVIRHCAYWVTLEGSGPTTRRRSVRVRIPRTNVFSVAGLQALMGRIRQRGKP